MKIFWVCYEKWFFVEMQPMRPWWSEIVIFGIREPRQVRIAGTEGLKSIIVEGDTSVIRMNTDLGAKHATFFREVD